MTGDILTEDTSENINVSGLIKASVSDKDLEDYLNRWKYRISSDQLKRQFRWKKNKHQYYKIDRHIRLAANESQTVC